MNENKGLLGSVMDWFAHPFQSNGSALDWVLFLGLLVAAFWFWQVILLDVTGKLEGLAEAA